MLKAVKSVRDEVLRRCNGGSIDLQTVTRVFEELTIIDEVTFVRYDTPPENPIWGRFTRWSRSPGVYAPATTMVEIGYAQHLPDDWRRFIVCKELCHALDSSDGNHAVTAETMDKLVGALAIRSAAGNLIPVLATFAPELLAEVGALEILFPLHAREAILAQNPGPDHVLEQALAGKYKIPLTYIRSGLDADYNKVMRLLLDGG